MAMDWLGFIGNLINRVPFERILIPPRDNTKGTGGVYFHSRKPSEPK